MKELTKERFDVLSKQVEESCTYQSDDAQPFRKSAYALWLHQEEMETEADKVEALARAILMVYTQGIARGAAEAFDMVAEADGAVEASTGRKPLVH